MVFPAWQGVGLDGPWGLFQLYDSMILCPDMPPFQPYQHESCTGLEVATAARREIQFQISLSDLGGGDPVYPLAQGHKLSAQMSATEPYNYNVVKAPIDCSIMYL